jgi:hypothetical protein
MGIVFVGKVLVIVLVFALGGVLCWNFRALHGARSLVEASTEPESKHLLNLSKPERFDYQL